jgi:hypothetical protein
MESVLWNQTKTGKKHGNEQIKPGLGYFLNTFLQGFRKTRKSLWQARKSPHKNKNLVLSKH